MAYDHVSKYVVMFGGFDENSYFNETWVFDGTWSKVNTSNAPPARAAANMAFDKVTRRLVLFGGFDGQHYLNDTWLWDGATRTWTQAHPALVPKAVTAPMLFTDPKDGHADLFGGYDGKFYQATTFRWKGNNWRQLAPFHSPSARSSAIVAYDAAAHYVVMYGGLADMRPDNTWTWDGADWTLQSPPTQPLLVYDAAGAYDPHLGRVIAFGGGHGGEDQNTTWKWNGTTWKNVATPQAPAARESFGMAYDKALGHLVIFGGLAGNTLMNDTWQLNRR